MKRIKRFLDVIIGVAVHLLTHFLFLQIMGKNITVIFVVQKIKPLNFIFVNWRIMVIVEISIEE